jgi:CheY-like chemotaxis protein
MLPRSRRASRTSGRYRAVLEEAGYAILSATNETEALEVLSEAPVCLVLSDHMLRGTTGKSLPSE